MKNNIIIKLTAAVAVAVMASCGKEMETIVPQSENGVLLTVNANSTETRVAISQNSSEGDIIARWEAEDKISVHNLSDGLKVGELSADASATGKQIGTFSGNVEIVKGNSYVFVSPAFDGDYRTRTLAQGIMQTTGGLNNSARLSHLTEAAAFSTQPFVYDGETNINTTFLHDYAYYNIRMGRPQDSGMNYWNANYLKRITILDENGEVLGETYNDDRQGAYRVNWTAANASATANTYIIAKPNTGKLSILIYGGPADDPAPAATSLYQFIRNAKAESDNSAGTFAYMDFRPELSAAAANDGKWRKYTRQETAGTISTASFLANTGAFHDYVTVSGNLDAADLTHIGDCNIEDLDLKNANVDVLPANAFAYVADKPLEKIVLPRSLISIEANAFSNQTSLTTVEFGDDDLIEIDPAAFAGCTNLSAESLAKINQHISLP